MRISASSHHQSTNQWLTAMTPRVRAGSSTSISSKVFKNWGMILVIITNSTTTITTMRMQG